MSSINSIGPYPTDVSVNDEPMIFKFDSHYSLFVSTFEFFHLKVIVCLSRIHIIKMSNVCGWEGGFEGVQGCNAQFGYLAISIFHGNASIPPQPRFSSRASSTFTTSICEEVVPITLDMNIDFHIRATSQENKATSAWCFAIAFTSYLVWSWGPSFLQTSSTNYRLGAYRVLCRHVELVPQVPTRPVLHWVWFSYVFNIV